MKLRILCRVGHKTTTQSISQCCFTLYVLSLLKLFLIVVDNNLATRLVLPA